MDGQELASKTVTQNGTVYVRTEEMEAALGVTLEQAQAVTIDGASWHDLYEVCEALDISILEDEEQERFYCTGGGYDDEVLQIAKDHYRFAITGKDITYITGDDPLQIPRYSVYRGKTMEQFIAMLDSVEYIQSE